MNLTKDQEIKIQLVALAEYLNTTLTDAQIRLYASELDDMTTYDLTMAISILKKDPEVWAGRMVLPAKIKSYLTGSRDTVATIIAAKILEMVHEYGHYNRQRAYELMGEDEKTVANMYGWKNLCTVGASQYTFVFSQLRNMAKAMLDSRISSQVISQEQIEQSAYRALTSPDTIESEGVA